MTLKSIEKLRKLTICDKGEKYTAYLDAGEIADEVEAEIAERYMELPVDADGVPIRVGDELYNGEVIALGGLAEGGVVFVHRGFEDGNYILEAFASNVTHHVKQRTVEDVLKEFGDWYKHVAGGCDEPGIIAKYADELRSMGVDNG